MELLQSVQKALKLLNEVEEASKNEGLELLSEILAGKKRLDELGYDKLIFKELVKMAQFETECLEKNLNILEKHYFSNGDYHDELAEMLIYRVARSNNREISHTCLEKLSSLVDNFDDSIAKHSKQILKLADLNDLNDLNPILSKILVKMGTKLPPRKKFDD